jgi:hypothetical protein
LSHRAAGGRPKREDRNGTRNLRAAGHGFCMGFFLAKSTLQASNFS